MAMQIGKGEVQIPQPLSKQVSCMNKGSDAKLGQNQKILKQEGIETQKVLKQKSLQFTP